MNNSQKSSLVFDVAFDDNITSIQYHQPSNNKNLLLTTCLDQTIRIIEYNVIINNSLDEAEFTSHHLTKCSALTEPLVCSNLDRYNNSLIVGTNQGKIYSFDMNVDRITQIGLHSEYIKNIYRLKDEDNSPLFSISYDGELKFWDLRMSRSIFSYDFLGKYLCGSYLFPIFLAGVNEKEIRCLNMNHLGYQEFGPCHSFTSPLGDKSVNIAIFPNLDGYIVNSDEGRCAVNHIKLNESQNMTDFIPLSNTR
jgi:WD40 repeat protein